MNVWIIVGVVLALLVVYVVGVYNGLIRLRNKVDDQASQIDVQLKRRFDLIPNLVETVKGYIWVGDDLICVAEMKEYGDGYKLFLKESE